MNNMTVGEILESFENLNDADKKFLLEIIRKQMIEKRRYEIADRVKEAESNYQSGDFSSGNADDLLRDLEND